MRAEPREVGLRGGRRATVRAAVPGDAEALRRYVLGLAKTSDQIITQPDEVGEAAGYRERVERVRPERGELWLVAEASDAPVRAGGDIVGDCVIRVPERRKLAHNGSLGMGVASGWRGLGLGRALLTAGVGWARAHPGLERLELSVLHTNEAGSRLYRSLGFAEEGRQAGRIRQPDGSYADEVLMVVRVG